MWRETARVKADAGSDSAELPWLSPYRCEVCLSSDGGETGLCLCFTTSAD